LTNLDRGTLVVSSILMNGFEHLLVKLDDPCWGACSRVLLGFLVVPAASGLLGETATTGWGLAVVLLAALFLVRAVSAVVRGVFPFSQDVLKLWGRRRGVGKRFDSYQWRKLFWIGLGMFGQTIVSREFHAGPVALSMVCIGSGGVGLIAWRTVDATLRNEIDARPDRRRRPAVVASESTAR
jgi:hypothetical protein